MATTTSTTTAPVITATDGTTGTTLENKNASAMDKDTFLKILVAQMKMQDPTQPTDSSQFMAQMAQFSTVEQLTNLGKTSADAAASAKVNQAVGLLGRTVTYADAGSAVSGVVQRVDIEDSGPTLTIDGVTGIDPAALIEVS
jgi:flagellar basal-body rod modification protein FlgD